MRWKLTMSSSDSLSSARSLRSGASRTAGRPAGSILPMSQPEPLMQITSTSSPSMSFTIGLDRGVAAAMQHQLRIAAEQARGVGAQRQIVVDALGRRNGSTNSWASASDQRDCMARLPSVLSGKRLRKPSGGGGASAAFGDEAGHQPRRRDVEAGIGGGAARARRSPPSRRCRRAVRPVIFSTSSGERSSMGMSRPDCQRPVDGGDWAARHRTARRCPWPPAPSDRCRSCWRHRHWR